jgi:hypothetical protein
MAATAQMLIANRLRDGFTVFLAADGSWVDDIAAGAVAHTSEEAAALLQVAEEAARRNVVVGPYLIAVDETPTGPRPVEWREAIRAFGPTVETGRAA